MVSWYSQVDTYRFATNRTDAALRIYFTFNSTSSERKENCFYSSYIVLRYEILRGEMYPVFFFIFLPCCSFSFE